MDTKINMLSKNAVAVKAGMDTLVSENNTTRTAYVAEVSRISGEVVQGFDSRFVEAE